MVYVVICVLGPSIRSFREALTTSSSSFRRRPPSSGEGTKDDASSCRDDFGNAYGVADVDDSSYVKEYGLDGKNDDGACFDGMEEDQYGACRYECADDERDSSRDYDEADPTHDDLIRLPRDSSRVGFVFWLLLYPLRFAMHRTIPHVGSSRHRHRRACASTASCLIWLCVSSYVMVTSLENLAEGLGMPNAAMGATVSAAGTSYPAYVASIMAATDGMGNRAVSNVFGSNTFNICVGLGMPWMAYIALTNGFRPYTDLEDDGVAESMAILFGTLLLFLVLLASTDFVMVEWHAISFVVLYVLYIVYTIGDVYW